MKSPAERKQEQREAKLVEIEREIEAGSLVVRQMTSAERAKYPPKERPERGRRRG